MYNNYYQPTQQVPVSYQPQVRQQLGLKGRPVSSIDEARASTVDFDGSVFYFPDQWKKRIKSPNIIQ